MIKKHPQAFTLIELTVVLIVIGLIAGGIAAGTELIRQGKIKGVISEIQAFQIAFNTFKEKFNYLPGDFPYATSLFPSSGNGNGNGQISYSQTVVGNGPEWLRAWDHLSQANLIPNLAYTGTNTPTSVPYSKAFNGYWGIGYETTIYSFRRRNYLQSTRDLGPTDLYIMDTKIDDGLAGRGKFLGLAPTPYIAGHCVTAQFTSSNANYILPDINNYNDCRIFYIIDN
ncbi:MAG: type II secretion system protein [Alphaproteobacteria bacterium]